MSLPGQRAMSPAAKGYGALIEYLVSECHRHGVSIHLGAAVTAIDAGGGRIAVRCHDGAIFEADAAILTVPLPCCPKSRFLRPHARRRRPVPISDSAMSSNWRLLKA